MRLLPSSCVSSPLLCDHRPLPHFPTPILLHSHVGHQVRHRCMHSPVARCRTPPAVHVCSAHAQTHTDAPISHARCCHVCLPARSACSWLCACGPTCPPTCWRPARCPRARPPRPPAFCATRRLFPGIAWPARLPACSAGPTCSRCVRACARARAWPASMARRVTGSAKRRFQQGLPAAGACVHARVHVRVPGLPPWRGARPAQQKATCSARSSCGACAQSSWCPELLLRLRAAQSSY